MVRYRLAPMILASALLLPSPLPAGSWLSESGDQPQPPTDPSRPLPEKAPGNPSEKWSGRRMNLRVRGKTVEQLLRTAIATLIPGREPPTLELEPYEALQKVNLTLKDVTFPEVLDALSTKIGRHLVLEEGTVRCAGAYEHPSPRPPTDEELQILAKPLSMQARSKPLGQVLGMVATISRTLALVPSIYEARKIDIKAPDANLAQLLEVIGESVEMRVWLDGRFLRLASRPSPPLPPLPAGPSRRISLRVHETGLAKVLRQIGMFHDKLVCIPASLAEKRVSLSIRDQPIEEILQNLGDSLDLEIYLDGPFLRVSRYPPSPAEAGPPRFQGQEPVRRTGPRWRPFLELLYPPPADPSPDFSLDDDDFADDF